MQERAVETRRRILTGAATVFDRRGYVAATLDEIMTEAGSTKGALYFHFRGKEDLARAILSEESRWATTFEQLVTDRPVQDIIDVTQGLAHGLLFDPLLRASYRMAVEYGTFDQPKEFTTYEMWSTLLVEAFQRARDRGDLRDEVRIEAAVEFLVASFTGMQVVSQVTSGRADLQDRVANWWTFSLPGLVPGDHPSRYLPHGSDNLERALTAAGV